MDVFDPTKDAAYTVEELLTREGLSDVDAGRVIKHQVMMEWADRL